MNRFFTSLFFLSISFFFSCEEDTTKPIEKPYAINPGSMLMVANEGNFRSGNASVSLYNLDTKTWLDDAYATFLKRSLGDVLQSITFWNGNAHFVVNNSAKIEVVKPNNFEQVQTIAGFTSPRFLLPINANKAYVTDLYANKIWIVSGTPLAISGSIPVNGWTEDMVLINNKVWVVNKSRPVLMILDANSDQLVDSLVLPSKPTSIAKGSNNQIWVGVEGITPEKPQILLVESASQTITRSFALFSPVLPDKFQSSVTGDSLFFVNDKPSMITYTPADYTLRQFTTDPGNWSGIGWNPIKKILAFSDVKDYVQRGKIILQYHDGTGGEVELSGGTISSRLYFY
ncbi:MAG TPA: hypothetical protein PKY12_13975 [Catalimonadaceae bacterium]|nr:hypothetical protein [Catalimonadaceae bacterium]